MNRDDLAKYLETKYTLTATQARDMIHHVLEALTEGFKRGDPIQLRGFGTFIPADRPARDARNPRTGETISVPASKTVRFRLSKELQQVL